MFKIFATTSPEDEGVYRIGRDATTLEEAIIMNDGLYLHARRR